MYYYCYICFDCYWICIKTKSTTIKIIIFHSNLNFHCQTKQQRLNKKNRIPVAVVICFSYYYLKVRYSSSCIRNCNKTHSKQMRNSRTASASAMALYFFFYLFIFLLFAQSIVAYMIHVV